jgi:hypothetical protein
MKNKTDVEGWVIGVAGQRIRGPFQWAEDTVAVRRRESAASLCLEEPGIGRSGYGGAAPCGRGNRPWNQELLLTARRALRFVARQPVT